MKRLMTTVACVFMAGCLGLSGCKGGGRVYTMSDGTQNKVYEVKCSYGYTTSAQKAPEGAMVTSETGYEFNTSVTLPAADGDGDGG